MARQGEAFVLPSVAKAGRWAGDRARVGGNGKRREWEWEWEQEEGATGKLGIGKGN